MITLIRALTYASIFVAFLLVFVPLRVLESVGIERSPEIGSAQFIGGALVLAGLGVSLACVLTFVFVGRGTPAPFDPPRRLVVRGPYRFVRNPMYIGAVVALAGAALFYASLALLVYALAFLLAAHLFVRLYEEPALHRTFGAEYAEYVRQVSRWLPHRPAINR